MNVYTRIYFLKDKNPFVANFLFLDHNPAGSLRPLSQHVPLSAGPGLDRCPIRRTGLFRPGQCPGNGEPLSGKRTTGIPCSGQDCSVSESVLVVENLCQVSGQKYFRVPDRTVPSRTVSLL